MDFQGQVWTHQRVQFDQLMAKKKYENSNEIVKSEFWLLSGDAKPA